MKLTAALVLFSVGTTILAIPTGEADHLLNKYNPDTKRVNPATTRRRSSWKERVEAIPDLAWGYMQKDGDKKGDSTWIVWDNSLDDGDACSEETHVVIPKEDIPEWGKLCSKAWGFTSSLQSENLKFTGCHDVKERRSDRNDRTHQAPSYIGLMDINKNEVGQIVKTCEHQSHKTIDCKPHDIIKWGACT